MVELCCHSLVASWLNGYFIRAPPISVQHMRIIIMRAHMHVRTCAASLAQAHKNICRYIYISIFFCVIIIASDTSLQMRICRGQFWTIEYTNMCSVHSFCNQFCARLTVHCSQLYVRWCCHGLVRLAELLLSPVVRISNISPHTSHIGLTMCWMKPVAK